MSATVALARRRPSPRRGAAVGDVRHRRRAAGLGGRPRPAARGAAGAVADYDGGPARIVAGSPTGDRVVVLGANKLEAGEPVRAVEAEG